MDLPDLPISHQHKSACTNVAQDGTKTSESSGTWFILGTLIRILNSFCLGQEFFLKVAYDNGFKANKKWYHCQSCGYDQDVDNFCGRCRDSVLLEKQRLFMECQSDVGPLIFQMDLDDIPVKLFLFTSLFLSLTLAVSFSSMIWNASLRNQLISSSMSGLLDAMISVLGLFSTPNGQIGKLGKGH